MPQQKKGGTPVPEVLDMEAVGVILGEHRTDGSTEPLAPRTVWLYLKDASGRYTADPLPEPDGYLGGAEGQKRTPYWMPRRVPELVAWAKRRPGSVKGGRTAAVPPTLAEGFVPCEECQRPIELHLADLRTEQGYQPPKGKAWKCSQRPWAQSAIRGARRAKGYNPNYSL